MLILYHAIHILLNKFLARDKSWEALHLLFLDGLFLFETVVIFLAYIYVLYKTQFQQVCLPPAVYLKFWNVCLWAVLSKNVVPQYVYSSYVAIEWFLFWRFKMVILTNPLIFLCNHEWWNITNNRKDCSSPKNDCHHVRNCKDLLSTVWQLRMSCTDGLTFPIHMEAQHQPTTQYSTVLAHV